MAKAPSKTSKPTPAAKPKKAVAALTKTTAKPKAQPAAAKPKAAPKPKTSAKPKAKSEPGVIKQTTDALSQLASDLLADRIVPTIEQIKSIAASALGQDQTKGKRAKKKK
jgi:hypothetical protein